MSKTKPFFPTLNTKGFLEQEPMTSFDKEQPYMPGRDKEALLFPQRVKDWSKTFQLQKTCDGSYFSKPVGQEFDKFDDVMVKYMRT